MNALDRAIGWVAPRAALSRARARHALRVYEGAGTGRRASSFKALNTSVNAEIQGALRPLRSRARELARNTPYAARMLDVMVAHTVGTGITPVPDTGSDVLDNRLDELFGDWERRADVTGQLGYYAMQALSVRAMIESGESVIRFIDRPLDDPRHVPLQLQLLEGDFIDQWRDGLYGADGAAGVEGLEHTRLGVGLGEYDRRVGLWLNPNHPGEINTANLRPGVSTFVPADELVHVFKVLRPGQVRGVSWFAPILMTARDLADFLDAVNVKARVEACFAGFITNNDESGGDLFDPSTPGFGRGGPNPDAMVTTIEPGMLKELRTGQDIKFAQPTTATQVAPMVQFNLQAMAVGVGCTYDQATGDLKGATFSSMKAGKIDFRRLVEQLQHHVVVPLVCQRPRDRFVSRAILAGLLPDDPACYRAQWVTPAWEPINPIDDIEADIKAVRTGRMPPQEFVAAWGNDWRKVQDQTRAFYRRADAMGLAYDIDPRRTDQSGKQQPAEAAAAAAAAKPPRDDTGEPVAAPALS